LVGRAVVRARALLRLAVLMAGLLTRLGLLVRPVREASRVGEPARQAAVLVWEVVARALVSDGDGLRADAGTTRSEPRR
jgi:hypothetical protein